MTCFVATELKLSDICAGGHWHIRVRLQSKMAFWAYVEWLNHEAMSVLIS